MRKILLRTSFASVVYVILLGVSLLVSCLPGNVTCTAERSPIEIVASEGLTTFTLAFLVILFFEWIVRRLEVNTPLFDVVLVALLAAPILVPFCIGAGCRVGRDYWMFAAVGMASLLATLCRRQLIRHSLPKV